MNERQIKMVNLLWDGFNGKLTSSKWGKITKCSADTALRDIQDLIGKGVLRKTNEGGPKHELRAGFIEFCGE